ncbi:MAG: phage integrase N-terminal SAM-like domain-containing protein [Chloroflexi bacterium]|nr:phage integrase N-terminal SAM-like domain-containing protein [Chloroflexota bacterium]
MVVKVQVATGLSALVGRFALWCRVEGKSPRTVDFYEGNLRRFLWYCQKEGYPQDVQDITPEHLADFFLYVGGAEKRWGIGGNGSERCRPKASRTTLRHYYRSLKVFFAWLIRERMLNESPLASFNAPRPEKPLIEPYTEDEIRQMLDVCQWDWEHNARFLGSRNKANILVLLDTGVRRSELEGLRLEDTDLVLLR